MYKTLVEAVLNHARNNGKKTAICFRDEILSYDTLVERVQNAVKNLKFNQIKAGNKVLITAVSKPEYIVAFLAVQYIGAIVIPIDKNAKLESIIDIIHSSDAQLFLTDTQSIADKIKCLPLRDISNVSSSFPEYFYTSPADGDILELLFTTGTTGKPKGVILTNKCIKANMNNTIDGIQMVKDDIVLLPLPLNHSFGIRVLRSTLYLGATIVLQNGFAFSKEIENNILRYKCTAMVCVPASMEIILGQMQDKVTDILGRLRYIEVSAGSLSVGTRKKVLELLPNTQIHNTWGSTESGGALFLNLRKFPDKIMSIGKPLPNISIKVVKEDNITLEKTDSSNPGRMSLKGEMQMEGYWSQDELTKETLKEGWLLTSDLVYLDEDGFVYMLGRADDIINVGGEKVSPIEVENVVSEYSGIKECACIGVKDTEGTLGEIPILYVVPNPTFNEKECLRFLSSKIEKYKIPQKLLFIDEIPRNSMKKVDRKQLRNRWETVRDANIINPVIQNILNRRSIRRFTDKEIDFNILNMVVTSGIYAPSGHNLQTWKFTVIRNKKLIYELRTLINEIGGKKKVHVYGFENPSCIILISNDRRNPDGIQDASCAAQNIMLAANSFGIGSVWVNALMTICDEPQIRDLLDYYNIPSEHIVWATIAMGYAIESGNLLAKKKDVIQYID